MTSCHFIVAAPTPFAVINSLLEAGSRERAHECLSRNDARGRQLQDGSLGPLEVVLATQNLPEFNKDASDQAAKQVRKGVIWQRVRKPRAQYQIPSAVQCCGK